MSYHHSSFHKRGTYVPAPLPPKLEIQHDLFDEAANELPDPMDLVRDGALVVHNSSGGKDSQALLIHLIEVLGVPPSQILSIHADLGESEWEHTREHAQDFAEAYGVEFIVAEPFDKDGNPKSFISMADARGMFPATNLRSCTSDLKRGPIRRVLNAWLRANPRSNPYVLNAMGLRAEESTNRANEEVFSFSQDASCPNAPWPIAQTKKTNARRRLVFDWNPIHHLTELQVFLTIAAAGQTPHWAYGVGARRLICLICIFSSEDDIKTALANSPKARCYAKKIIAVEDRHTHTILPLKNGKQRFLREVIEAMGPIEVRDEHHRHCKQPDAHAA